MDGSEENRQFQRQMQDLAVKWTAARPVVAAFISSLVTNFHDAEDLLQKTASTLVVKYTDYDQSRPFPAWAIGIARIEVLRYRQERQRDRHVFDERASQVIAEAYQELAPDVGGMLSALQHCIGSLRGRTRHILVQRYILGLAVGRIAKELHTSANAIYVALHRSRAVLSECMEQRLRLERGGA